MLCASLLYRAGSRFSSMMARSMVGVISISLYCFFSWWIWLTSRYVSVSRPARTAWKPVYGMGRKIPPRWTISPGFIIRVKLPLTWTVIDRGMWPTGTWSAYDRIIDEKRRRRSEDCTYHFLDLDLLEWVEPTSTRLHMQRPTNAVLFALCVVLAVNYRRELLV